MQPILPEWRDAANKTGLGPAAESDADSRQAAGSGACIGGRDYTPLTGHTCWWWWAERGCACSQFFLNGKTLPIDRGLGLQQPAMQTAAGLLAGGDWVHLFPEGRVGYSGRMQPCKWGVGKLVCDAVTQSGR